MPTTSSAATIKIAPNMKVQTNTGTKNPSSIVAVHMTQLVNVLVGTRLGSSLIFEPGQIVVEHDVPQSWLVSFLAL